MYGIKDTSVTMKRHIVILLFSVLATLSWTSCFPDDYLVDKHVVTPQKPEPKPEPEPEPDPEPDPEPEPEDPLTYDNLSEYGPLKSYVNRTISPDFKMGAAIGANDFINKRRIYDLAVENLDEMTAENAMKAASIIRSDGWMDFNTVKRFVEAADAAGMTV